MDAAVFRDVLGRFASGITVVAGLDGAEPVGFACQSFASLSIDPPLVMLAVGKTSTSWPRIERAGRFCVSILAEDQQEVCAALGASGRQKFAAVPWRTSAHGTVVIDGALATVDCRLAAVHEAGDHHIVTGEVVDLAARENGRPLLYFRSRYAAGAFSN
ncbi:flavin reductase family protein [Streptomyces sp. LHD-70]|uniref:flavin reductase family protein n=1 Tax=Streptomyces sp. LHD-70 TaxID=3072140 RepID=UPI00280F995F|nr:flavin reductase family protein [Streptomyces sp. LHD-70]MDQ8706029.1 flavin reductase family protein [Streptomyces sp. LHD-70]